MMRRLAALVASCLFGSAASTAVMIAVYDRDVSALRSEIEGQKLMFQWSAVEHGIAEFYVDGSPGRPDASPTIKFRYLPTKAKQQ